MSAEDWLVELGQNSHTIDMFWAPIIISTINEMPDKVSATVALKVIKEGFLRNKKGYHLGVPKVPLSFLHGEPCYKYLRARGVQIRRGVEVQTILSDGQKAIGVSLVDGTILHPDYIVAAVPPKSLIRLIPKEIISDFPSLQHLSSFRNSPITTVHFWMDQDVHTADQTALLGRNFQWVFHRHWKIPPVGGGSYFQMVSSASHLLLGISKEELSELALHELQSALPEALGVRLLSFRVIKQPHATIALQPGSQQWRSGPQSPIQNIFLAGDWTNTGWPATMESAVRSGHLVSECILSQCGQSVKLLQPDLKSDGLSKWLIKDLVTNTESEPKNKKQKSKIKRSHHNKKLHEEKQSPNPDEIGTSVE
jgi:uncharacterized protein with NAD-binding domain and iron-sulfur cluster